MKKIVFVLLTIMVMNSHAFASSKDIPMVFYTSGKCTGTMLSITQGTPVSISSYGGLALCFPPYENLLFQDGKFVSYSNVSPGISKSPARVRLAEVEECLFGGGVEEVAFSLEYSLPKDSENPTEFVIDGVPVNISYNEKKLLWVLRILSE